MKVGFNDLELGIIEFMATLYSGSLIAKQLMSAQFVQRDWTRAGIYVYFKVDTTLGQLDLELKGPINGPLLQSDGIDLGGACLFWADNGYLHCIEMYANGEFFDEVIEDCKLLRGF